MRLLKVLFLLTGIGVSGGLGLAVPEYMNYRIKQNTRVAKMADGAFHDAIKHARKARENLNQDSIEKKCEEPGLEVRDEDGRDALRRYELNEAYKNMIAGTGLRKQFDEKDIYLDVLWKYGVAAGCLIGSIGSCFSYRIFRRKSES